MVQTMGFSEYVSILYCVPLLYCVIVFTFMDRVVITVYKGISPLSFIFKVCACIIIVSVSTSITLGERFCGKLRFGVDFSRLTNGVFYAIIETSFTA